MTFWEAICILAAIWWFAGIATTLAVLKDLEQELDLNKNIIIDTIAVVLCVLGWPIVLILHRDVQRKRRLGLLRSGRND